MMKSFKEHINECCIPDNINESSLSRIMTHVEKTPRFGVISAYRKGNSCNDNNHLTLVRLLKTLGYGYISLIGGYQEESGFVNEKSFFIPNITRKEITDLGYVFDQFSVLHKNKSKFSEIGTNKNAGKGNIINKFVTDGKNIAVDDVGNLFTDFFSKLLKGSHRGKKFLFVSEIQTGSQFVGSRIIYEDVFTGEIYDNKTDLDEGVTRK